MICNCISSAVVDFATSSLTLLRASSGYFDAHGRWQPRDAQPEKFFASVQPLRPEELKDLPEGRRATTAIKLYTTTKLRTASVNRRTQPDVIIPDDGLFKGIEFQVDSVSDWFELGGYFKVLATKRGQ